MDILSKAEINRLGKKKYRSKFVQKLANTILAVLADSAIVQAERDALAEQSMGFLGSQKVLIVVYPDRFMDVYTGRHVAIKSLVVPSDGWDVIDSEIDVERWIESRLTPSWRSVFVPANKNLICFKG